MKWITRFIDRQALSLFLVLSLAPAAARAQRPVPWDSVARVLQASPTGTTGYMQYALPRRDLALRIGGVNVSPRLSLTAWARFSGTAQAATLMGDLVVTEAELRSVEAAIDTQRLTVTAVYNPLLGEAPRLTYLHVHGEGPLVELARRLDRVIARTATPRGMSLPATAPVTIDTASLFQALDARGSASGNVAQFSFVLIAAPVSLRGARLVPGQAYGSRVGIQSVTADRYFATGDLVVLSDRVAPVVGALAAHGIAASAVHNRLIGETPAVYDIHFWADGPPAEVIAGIKAALDAVRSP
ncbi:MAG TPA: DUF1259 domain-containing protein [Gemmatimonadales bacterium]|jgi:hypothetical protein